MSKTENSAPNIVLIVTDQQRWDTLGCLGYNHVITPHIDRLAARITAIDGLGRRDGRGYRRAGRAGKADDGLVRKDADAAVKEIRYIYSHVRRQQSGTAHRRKR